MFKIPLLPNNTEIHSFRKMLQNYQPVEDHPEIMAQKVQVALELETHSQKIPRLATADNVYNLMTTEFMRGSRVLHAAESRAIFGGHRSIRRSINDEDLGLYICLEVTTWMVMG